MRNKIITKFEYNLLLKYFYNSTKIINCRNFTNSIDKDQFVKIDISVRNS